MKYWITEVCHGEKHIEKVKIFKSSGKPEIWTKGEVVESIKNGNEIYTMIKVKGEWKLGAKVKTFQRNEMDYIHTVRDEVAQDNLGKLTKFSCRY
ncbi:MAG: DUF3892 domain-containing protein [Methanobacterium sp.]|jgi:hypothetical protein